MTSKILLLFFFCYDTSHPDIYTLSLHDALPILRAQQRRVRKSRPRRDFARSRPLGRKHHGGHAVGPVAERRPRADAAGVRARAAAIQDRKSTRLNSSHLGISYAVFCLKKKKTSTAASRPNASTTQSRSP